VLVINGYVVLAESVSAQGMWRSFMAPATVKLHYSNSISVFDPKRTRCTKKKKVKDNAGISLTVFSLELAEVFAYVRFKASTGDARVMFA
jgi:hypothetical protein